MPAITLWAFDLPRWGMAFPVLIGASCTALALVVGFLLLGKRKQQAPPARAPQADPSVTGGPFSSGARTAPAPQADPFVTGSARERRVAARREGAVVEVRVAPPGQEAAAGRAWVVDRSLGGICLKTDQAVEAGTTLNVRPCAASHLAPWVEVEVKYCEQEEDGWRVGCRFLRTPPWGVLILFG
jgi:hypothetical protein